MRFKSKVFKLNFYNFLTNPCKLFTMHDMIFLVQLVVDNHGNIPRIRKLHKKSTKHIILSMHCPCILYGIVQMILNVLNMKLNFYLTFFRLRSYKNHFRHKKLDKHLFKAHVEDDLFKLFIS